MSKNINAEKLRLNTREDNKGWKKWGPYLSERQWGTVREDYSPNQDAWNAISHDMSRSIAYRWGEEGIAGISDYKSLICFAISLCNHNDHILKERFFGLTGNDSNHGEDVKELYYYLESNSNSGWWYSIKTSKYSSLSKIPVSSISYSGSKRERLRLSSTNLS